jgi:conjugal transfer ATP-binding protein TraC
MLNIERQFSRFADYCGLKTPAERGFSPKKEVEKLLAEDTKGAKPLAENLIYRHTEDSSGVVWSDDSIGCWYEINPIVGSNDSIEKNLTLFFADELPEGGYLQFLIVASHEISNILDLWESKRIYGGKPIEKLTRYRRDFIEKLSKDFEGSAEDGRLPRNYRTYVTYSTKDTGEKSVEQLIKFSRKLKNKLKAERLNPRKCTSGDLIYLIRDLLQMSFEKRRLPKYSVINNLADQVVDPFTPNTVEIDHIKHHNTGLISKVLAPKELPESFCLSEMINLLGSDTKSIPGRFVISYTVANNLGGKGKSAIDSAGSKSIHASKKSYAKDDLVAQEEAQQWKQVKALTKKGESYLQESMLIMLTAPSEDIEIAEETLKSLYNSQDWKLEVCSRIQRIASLSMLPMMQYSYWKALKFFRLTRYALSGEVVAKLPIQGEWRGVPVSGAMFIGRRGQLFNWNPFYRIGGGGNYNVIILAPPGSGKTFLTLEMVQSLIAQDVAMFIIDIGDSYKNLCQAIDGEHIVFDSRNKMSLNPFANMCSSGAKYMKAKELLDEGKTPEEVILITGVSLEELEAIELGKSGFGGESSAEDAIELLEVESQHNPSKKYFVTKDSLIYARMLVTSMTQSSGISRLEELVERSILEGIALHGEDLDITKLSEVLDNLKDRRGNSVQGASEIADSLFPYTESGSNGRFFKQGKTATFKKKITVFELEQLKNDDKLLNIVLQVILMNITMQFLCGDRSRNFMLVVDEAWFILDKAAAFLEGFSRTVRKYGGSLVVVTQSLGSFLNKCGTKKSQEAVLECATWKLILQQSNSSLEAFASSEAFKDLVPLIETLRKCENNKFSEVLINTDGATVVGRAVADPYSVAMFSTEKDDYNFLVQKEKEGLTKEQALMELSKKYGTLPDLGEMN